MSGPPALSEPERTRRRRRNDLFLLGAALGVIALAAALQVTPARDGVSLLGHQLPEVCAAKRLGISCPGCGLTRSFVLGVRGDPAAFRLHPLGPLLLALVALQLPFRGLRLLRGSRPGVGRLDALLFSPRWDGVTVSGILGFSLLSAAVWAVRLLG